MRKYRGPLYQRKSISVKISIQIIMILYIIVAIFPVYFMFSASFKTNDEFLYNKYGLPEHPTLVSFKEAVRGGEKFLRWFINTMLVTFFSVLVSLICAVFAAFAMTHSRFRGHKLLFNGTISLMVIPPVVMIIPLFVFMQRLGFINNYLSVIVIYTGIILPFSIYVLHSFFKTIPSEILDAALVDGCSSFTIMWRIVVPLAGPAVVTICVVNALFVWNELIIAIIFLQLDRVRTLMASIMAFKSKYNIDLPVTMAGLVLMSIPMITLYLAGTKYFIKGLIAGSIKG